MKLYRLIIFTLPIFFAISAHSTPDQFNRYFISATKISKPSVVNIIVYKNISKGNKSHLFKTAHGSGTVIFHGNYIVTNYHLIKKGNIFHISDYRGLPIALKKFSDGKFFRYDNKTDIALFKIRNKKYYKPIKISNSNKIKEGEWVIAIGNPFGLRQTITSGIISSKGRDNIGFTDIEDFIQSDVAINPGNSGGPLVNLEGEMVGLNTAITTLTGGYQGISFAIPSNIVNKVCFDLIRYARVRRGWLGFIIKEKIIDRIQDRRQVEIISVVRNSPADIANLMKGDIINEIDGKQVISNSRLIKYLAHKSIGSKVYFSITRNGKSKDIRLILREKHIYHKIKKGIEDFYHKYGVEVDENANDDTIIISHVSPKTSLFGLQKGDMIISINRKKVLSMDDFMKVYYRSKKSISTMRVFRERKYYLIEFGN